MRRPTKSKKFKLQKRHSELQEIELLESWIELSKPHSGSNPLSLSPLPEKSRIGKLPDGSFSRYAGVEKFSQLPLSKRTKDGLAESKYSRMTDIQRASLPHSLCARDILGAAKTGSGKTLAFIIPVCTWSGIVGNNLVVECILILIVFLVCRGYIDFLFFLFGYEPNIVL